MKMLRTISLHSSSDNCSSPLLSNDHAKYEKAKKYLPQVLLPFQPRSPLSDAVFSSFCLFVGVAGIVFFLLAVFRPKSTPVFGSGRTEDTFRPFYSLPTARRLGGDSVGIADHPKFLGSVVIQTGFSSSNRPAALRNTWFPFYPDSLLRFVIGRATEAKKMAELEREVEQYKDFMLLDAEKEYPKLPYKTLAFFKAGFELFEAEYYMLKLMMKFICARIGLQLSWLKYEKSGHVFGNEYFLHAYGPIYVLSTEVVASLAIARNNSLRMFSNKDVTVGSWMLAMNVHHKVNRAICDPRCTPTSIAVWDIPKCSGLCNSARRMKELHKMSLSSKSPTLAPDDR